MMSASRPSTDADVAVIGAGLSGLSAARALEAHGLTVVVLEAADEVGGRTRSHSFGDQVADLGGEWVGPHHTHMVSLVRALGLTLDQTGFLGAPIFWRGAGRQRVSRLPGRDIAWPLLRTQLKMAKLVEGVSSETPWTAERAAELDGLTYAEWLRSEGVEGNAYRYLTDLVGALSSMRAEHISLLQVVWWSARAGGAFSMLRNTVQWRVAEGAQTVCSRLAERIRGPIHLHTAVTRISQNGAVNVETEDGKSYLVRRAIVTAPVGTSPAIAYDPSLCSIQQRIEKELVMEPGIKVSALLPASHSVKQKLALGGGHVGTAWRYGDLVVGFVAPWESHTDDETVLADLAAAFGLRPEQLRVPQVMRWSERPRIPGGDLGFRPGQLTTLAPLLGQAHGLIGFAGAERSSWPNNMEGAVASGLRTAARVAAAIGQV